MTIRAAQPLGACSGSLGTASKLGKIRGPQMGSIQRPLTGGAPLSRPGRWRWLACRRSSAGRWGGAPAAAPAAGDGSPAPAAGGNASPAEAGAAPAAGGGRGGPAAPGGGASPAAGAPGSGARNPPSLVALGERRAGKYSIASIVARLRPWADRQLTSRCTSGNVGYAISEQTGGPDWSQPYCQYGQRISCDGGDGRNVSRGIVERERWSQQAHL